MCVSEWEREEKTRERALALAIAHILPGWLIVNVIGIYVIGSRWYE